MSASKKTWMKRLVLFVEKYCAGQPGQEYFFGFLVSRPFLE